MNFLKGVNGFSNELAALEVIRLKTKSIIEKLLQPIEPMGLITHTDFWCNNLLVKDQKSDTDSGGGGGDDDDSNKRVDCVILDWQMITYSRWVKLFFRYEINHKKYIYTQIYNGFCDCDFHLLCFVVRFFIIMVVVVAFVDQPMI